MNTKQAFHLTLCDKGFIHEYYRFYDEIFRNFCPESLLEIGIMNGRSLASWRLRFPKCKITGIDISDEKFNSKLINFSQSEIIIADSTKPTISDKIKETHDVIIDDGSHYYRDIMRTFKNLHNKFNHYYIIEDYYYDIDLARQYINKLGFTDVNFYTSKNSNIKIADRRIFTHKTTKKYRIIDQNLIVIKR